MSMKRTNFGFLVAVFAIVIFAAGSANALTTCTFTNQGSTMKLNGNCSTDSSIVIPNGKTLDGRGFTITGVDPAGNHFHGAVVVNGGASASVKNLGVTVSGLIDACDAGADRLRGIMFEGASGSITSSTVSNINQGPSGCQEGNAIEVRNFGANLSTSRVNVSNNTITGYQKTGIVANGNVEVHASDNLVDGGGPVGYIARNGIQFGFGGSGSAMRNTVNGNSYSGTSTVSGGILVYGETGAFCIGVQIVQNTISGNDVGVFVSQLEDDSSPPLVATNTKVINNVISHASVTNGYIYQAGVSMAGNNDKIISNTISGAGYDPATLPGATFAIDADPLYATRTKVHANR